ncbi:MAG: hypothetical protein HY692_00535 [Cyanobacteria bacterium NC_groundwater_1444_Ag_S-0.65um_54_12]|nr:hypothetical protein [Cyanobacteria bacterium NC_groundwater_1444_Ag_S-0.65um_54_12]
MKKRLILILGIGCSTLLLPSFSAQAALPNQTAISILQQLEGMLSDVESEAIRQHPDAKTRLRNVTISLQGVIEDNILSANKQVVMNPQAILRVIEEELAKGGDKKIIAKRLVHDQLAGYFYAK